VHPEASGIGFNLAMIGLAMLLLGLGLAYLVTDAARALGAAKPQVQMVSQTVGGRELHFPSDWLREQGVRREGFAQELRLRLPFASAAGQQHLVDVTLVPKSKAQPSGALLDAVYLHMFEPGQVAGVSGLVGKPMTPGNGYDGEVVWYDPLSPQPFVAKCMAPMADEPSGKCLRTVLVGDKLAAIYSFDAEALADWRDFDPAMRTAFARIGVY